jgi:hypothetical protein
MQAMCEVAQFRQSRLQLDAHGIKVRARVLGQVAVRRQPHLQLQRDGYESLLGAVVQVALDLAPRPVGCLQDPRARGTDLSELGLDDLALAQRLLGGTTRRDVEDRSVEPAPAIA